MSLWGKRDSLDGLPKYASGTPQADNVVFEDAATIYQDGFAGSVDPSARPGWYFKNSVAGRKINWYLLDGFNEVFTLGDCGLYMVVTMDSVSSAPFLLLYTMKEGAGDFASWYRSRKVMVVPVGAAVAGTKYLIHTGIDPVLVHPELPRIQMIPSVVSTSGPQGANERILFGAIGTNSVAAVNSVEFVAESFGVVSSEKQREVSMRIRASYTDPESPEAPKGDAAEMYLVDTQEVTLARSKGIKGSGWFKYKTLTNERGEVRHYPECLVAMRVKPSDSGDRGDNELFPNGLITITTQPQDVSVADTEAVVFSVIGDSSSNSDLAYQWQESSDGETFVDVVGARLASYSFAATLAKNGYSYRVVVDSVDNPQVISEVVTLTVTA